MNQKILAGLMMAVIVLVSIHLTVVLSNEMDVKKLEEFKLDSDQDLKLVAASLAIRMWEEQIFLEMEDIHRLVTSDREIDLIRLFPNDMNGQSGGKGTWDDGYSLNSDLPDGTRTWEEFSKNGTLLKSIKIYDEPEKEILIILK